jgi:hypothetical protein
MEFPPNTRSAHNGTGHWSRVAAVIGFTAFTTLTVPACSRNSSSAGGAALSVAELRAAPEHGTLSREPSVTVEVPESDLHSGFQRLTDRCTADSGSEASGSPQTAAERCVPT